MTETEAKNAVLSHLNTAQLLVVLEESGYHGLDIYDSNYKTWTATDKAQYQIYFDDEEDEDGHKQGVGYVYVWVEDNQIKADF